jgi:predicted nucleotidyltransferase
MEAQPVLQLVAAICGSSPGVLLAYLFGSRVDGSTGPMSDVDVAVLLDRAADPTATRSRVAHRLRLSLEANDVDVLILNQAPIELAYGVIAEGTIAFAGSEAARVEYEATVMSRYGDYLPVLRAFRTDIVQGDDYAHRVQRYRAALGRFDRTTGQAASADRQIAN